MLKWRKATVGGVRIQAVCPYCGNRVKHSGQIDINTHRHELRCDCGAVLKVLFSQSFEWEKDVPISDDDANIYKDRTKVVRNIVAS